MEAVSLLVIIQLCLILGNEFSTLEGVEFQWSLSNWNSHQESETNSDRNVLQLITFGDSPYETPPTIKMFDDVGKHGHIVLLEGTKTGAAKVSGVSLPCVIIDIYFV
jgi:nuclear pore complex protein Nup210